MSVLEPLVIVLAKREVAQAAVEEGIPIVEASGSSKAIDWVNGNRAFADRVVADTERRGPRSPRPWTLYRCPVRRAGCISKVRNS